MKIYYYDGELRDLNINDGPYNDYTIWAEDGYKSNTKQAQSCFEQNPNCTILTNQITLLNSYYCWNKELNRPEVYLWCERHKCWEHITTRYENIRITNNIMKMYMAGMFEEDDGE